MKILDLKTKNGYLFPWLHARVKQGVLTPEDEVLVSRDLTKGDLIEYCRNHDGSVEYIVVGTSPTNWKKVVDRSGVKPVESVVF